MLRDILDNLICIIICFLLLFAVCGSIKHNLQKTQYIKELETQINQLKFKQEYLDFVYEDNMKQEV